MDTSGTKLKLGLLPPIALMECARVLQFGSDKHGLNNWLNKEEGKPREFKEFDVNNYIDAMKRHMMLIELGEEIDDETETYHLAHIATTAMIMMDRLHRDDPKIKSPHFAPHSSLKLAKTILNGEEL